MRPAKRKRSNSVDRDEPPFLWSRQPLMHDVPIVNSVGQPVEILLRMTKPFHASSVESGAWVLHRKNHVKIHVTMEANPADTEAIFAVVNGQEFPVSQMSVSACGVRLPVTEEPDGEPLLVEMAANRQGTKALEGKPILLNSKAVFERLHFVCATPNNARCSGKPNPKQSFFAIRLSLHVACEAGVLEVVSYVSAPLIVRGGNPSKWNRTTRGKSIADDKSVDASEDGRKSHTPTRGHEDGRKSSTPTGVEDEMAGTLLWAGTMAHQPRTPTSSEGRDTPEVVRSECDLFANPNGTIPHELEIPTLDVESEFWDVDDVTSARQQYEYPTPQPQYYEAKQTTATTCMPVATAQHQMMPQVTTFTGAVGVNTVHPRAALDVVGDAVVMGQLYQPSDRRLKTDFATVDPESQLENVKNIQQYTYKYSENVPTTGGMADTGVVAQELQAVVPRAVQAKGDITMNDGTVVDDVLVVDKNALLMENLGATKALAHQSEDMQRDVKGIKHTVAELKADVDVVKDDGEYNTNRVDALRNRLLACSCVLVVVLLMVTSILVALLISVTRLQAGQDGPKPAEDEGVQPMGRAGNFTIVLNGNYSNFDEAAFLSSLAATLGLSPDDFSVAESHAGSVHVTVLYSGEESIDEIVQRIGQFVVDGVRIAGMSVRYVSQNVFHAGSGVFVVGNAVLEADMSTPIMVVESGYFVSVKTSTTGVYALSSGGDVWWVPDSTGEAAIVLSNVHNFDIDVLTGDVLACTVQHVMRLRGAAQEVIYVAEAEHEVHSVVVNAPLGVAYLHQHNHDFKNHTLVAVSFTGVDSYVHYHLPIGFDIVSIAMHAELGLYINTGHGGEWLKNLLCERDEWRCYGEFSDATLEQLEECTTPGEWEDSGSEELLAALPPIDAARLKFAEKAIARGWVPNEVSMRGDAANSDPPGESSPSSAAFSSTTTSPGSGHIDDVTFVRDLAFVFEPSATLVVSVPPFPVMAGVAQMDANIRAIAVRLSQPAVNGSRVTGSKVSLEFTEPLSIECALRAQIWMDDQLLVPTCRGNDCKIPFACVSAIMFDVPVEIPAEALIVSNGGLCSCKGVPVLPFAIPA